MSTTVKTADATTSEKVVGLKIERRFTSDAGPYEGVEWERRQALIVNPDKSVVFQMDDVEVPSTWSQLATDIIADKYFRKAGVPQSDGSTGAEHSARQVVDRVAQAIRQTGEKQGGYFASTEEAQIFQDELTHLLIHQKGAFNSPVWFNLGLFESYGIKGNPVGCWTPISGEAKETTSCYENPAISACFIQTVDDDLMDIAAAVQREMRVFKGGGGSGMNYSKIRGAGETLSGGGSSSGLMSFLDIFDKAAGATKSGGTTRRAARMVILDADHPDIIEFVRWKAREEDKVALLVKGGMSADFNSEAYQTVSGQNANNSVRVTDKFMRSVERDGDWQTVFRTSGEVADTLKARELMGEISQAAWRCADPGLQFHDTINKWNTVPDTGVIRASNPCAEFVFLDNTSCNLASLNLLQFLKPDGTFDIDSFEHACRVFILAQEIIVDYASYPTQGIAHNSHRMRPLGLGYANLGALLMQLGIPYDSSQGRAMAAVITSIMAGAAWQASAEIARAKGPFAEFAQNKRHMMRVGRMHAEAIEDVPPRSVPNAMWDRARAIWQGALKAGERYGFRNAQLTLLAPTGTISFLMDCDTTGIEPDFALVKSKKLAGGGQLRIVNRSVRPALKRLGYNEEQIQGIVDHVDASGTIEGAPGLDESHLAIFDCASPSGEGTRSIRPMGHVEIMAAVQPFLCGSISKTVNMPTETTVDEIHEVYTESWRRGLKCIAIYRDNSKGCQVLNARKEVEQIEEEKTRPQRQRLPKKRPGITQEAMIAGHKVYLRTGDYPDGKLGEIFVSLHKQGAPLRAWADSFAIAISLGLQYGVPLEELVSAFTFARFEPAGIVTGHDHVKACTSIVDYIFRALAVEYLDRIDLAHVGVDGQDRSRGRAQRRQAGSRPERSHGGCIGDGAGQDDHGNRRRDEGRRGLPALPGSHAPLGSVRDLYDLRGVDRLRLSAAPLLGAPDAGVFHDPLRQDVGDDGDLLAEVPHHPTVLLQQLRLVADLRGLLVLALVRVLDREGGRLLLKDLLEVLFGQLSATVRAHLCANRVDDCLPLRGLRDLLDAADPVVPAETLPELTTVRAVQTANPDRRDQALRLHGVVVAESVDGIGQPALELIRARARLLGVAQRFGQLVVGQAGRLLGGADLGAVSPHLLGFEERLVFLGAAHACLLLPKRSSVPLRLMVTVLPGLLLLHGTLCLECFGQFGGVTAHPSRYLLELPKQLAVVAPELSVQFGQQ
jgi:ribonucleoside-diphosphate reductase alpha chain